METATMPAREMGEQIMTRQPSSTTDWGQKGSVDPVSDLFEALIALAVESKEDLAPGRLATLTAKAEEMRKQTANLFNGHNRIGKASYGQAREQLFISRGFESEED